MTRGVMRPMNGRTVVRRRDDFIVRIARLLDGNPRVAWWRVERRTKHRALVFLLDGAEQTLFMSKTASDWRGPIKMESQLRRVLRGGGINEQVRRAPNGV